LHTFKKVLEKPKKKRKQENDENEEEMEDEEELDEEEVQEESERKSVKRSARQRKEHSDDEQQVERQVKKVKEQEETTELNDTEFGQFKTILFNEFNRNHAQSLSLDAIMEAIGEKLTLNQVKACLQKLQDENHVMVSDNMIFLI